MTGNICALAGRQQRGPKHVPAQQLDSAEGHRDITMATKPHTSLQIEVVLVVLEEKLPQLSDRLNSILGQTMV